MKLKIKDIVEKEEEDALEFSLEMATNGQDIILKSRKNKEAGSYYEFRIKPNGSWEKCMGGNLKDSLNE